MNETTCNQCSKVIKRVLSKIRKFNYCSRKCVHKSRVGKPGPWLGKKRLHMTGKNHWFWKGGKEFNPYGYILQYAPNHPRSHNNKVLQHRLIVEKQIGRYLTPKEQVHHLGKITDNRPHKLMAFNSRGAHNRFERGCLPNRGDKIIFDGRLL